MHRSCTVQAPHWSKRASSACRLRLPPPPATPASRLPPLPATPAACHLPLSLPLACRLRLRRLPPSTSSLVKRPQETTTMARRRRTPGAADDAAAERPAHARREMGARGARTLFLAAVLLCVGGMAAPAAAAPARPRDALSRREHVALPPPDPHVVALQADSRPEVRLFTFGFLAGGRMDLYLEDYHVRAAPAAARPGPATPPNAEEGALPWTSAPRPGRRHARQQHPGPVLPQGADAGRELERPRERLPQRRDRGHGHRHHQRRARPVRQRAAADQVRAVPWRVRSTVRRSQEAAYTLFELEEGHAAAVRAAA